MNYSQHSAWEKMYITFVVQTSLDSGTFFPTDIVFLEIVTHWLCFNIFMARFLWYFLNLYMKIHFSTTNFILNVCGCVIVLSVFSIIIKNINIWFMLWYYPSITLKMGTQWLVWKYVGQSICSFCTLWLQPSFSIVKVCFYPKTHSVSTFRVKCMLLWWSLE